MAERDKKPPINEVSKIYIDDFSGGLNSTISGSLLNINEAQVATNISFEQKGTLRPRQGRRKRYLVPFDSMPVTGMGVYYKSDGTSRLLVATGANIYADTPHLATKWTEKADWEQAGTSKSTLLDTTIEEGSILIKAGNHKLLKSATFGTSTSTSNSTYGYAITPQQDIVVRGFKVYKAKKNKDYGLHIWKASDKSLVFSKIVISDEDTTEWKDFFIAPITLLKDNEYRFAISCVDADILTRISNHVFNTEYVIVDVAYSSTGIGKYVTTLDPNPKAIDLIFDGTDFVKVINNSNKSEGVSTNLQTSKFKLDVEQQAITYVDTTKADFDSATLTSVNTSEVSGSVVLDRTV